MKHVQVNLSRTAEATKPHYGQLENICQRLDTSGAWWHWLIGSTASMASQDLALSWMLRMHSNLGRHEARATVTAALRGDHRAQGKVQDAIQLEKETDRGEPS